MNNPMVLPILPRASVAPPESDDPEVWQPSWRCFCCHDSGWVRHPNLVIPDYEYNQDKNIVCQSPKCKASENLLSSPLIIDNPESFDFRFTPRICQEIDQIVREDFRKSAQSRQASIAQQKLIKSSNSLAQKMNLRSRDRTNEENDYAAENLMNAAFKLEAVNQQQVKEQVVDEDFVASCC
jgi:hypothetical protein